MLDIVNPLQSLSYTNKDFVSIYTELLDLTKELASNWDPTISNESDPGVILLKLNAIIGDKLSYNSDTNVLELFPLSVTQEKNARQLFEQLGYYMHWYKAATTNVSITWEGTKSLDEEYTIPAFTVVSDFNNKITYALVGPVDDTNVNTFKVGSQKLKLDGSATSFKAIQGIPVAYSINGETTITVNNLDSNNRLYFPTTDIAENGIFITNINANNYTDWKKVDNLLVQTVSSGNLFYSFGITQDMSTCYIEFPENAEEIIKNGINITYIKTLGEEGNVSYKTIEKFFSEISPEEDDTVVFTTDNIRMLNYTAAINGEDPQSISSAYKGYKSTVGVFETLVTLRDYIGYILRSGLVSNGFVCDRTNDVQCSYNIMAQANDIDQIVNVVEQGGSNSPVLSAFDLKLYLLQLPTNEMVTKSVYDSSFEMMKEPAQENIKKYIDDVKCISHDYAHLLPVTTTKCHFCYFKNKYPISCRIMTQYQLTNTSANEVVTNIREALYKNLNAQEIEFGQEIPAELIYNIILGSDERIKNVMLDNIEYTTYAVCYDEVYKIFIDVNVSDEDKNPVSVLLNKSAKFTVDVDEEVFTEKIGVGNYPVLHFIYHASGQGEGEWVLDTESGQQTVSLDEYGITISYDEGQGPKHEDYMYVNISLKTQCRDEIFTKSVLAGTTQFLVEDEEYDYRLNQWLLKDDFKMLSSIEAIATDLGVLMSRVDDEYVLRDNETIQLYSPNLVDSTTYSNFVKFEYRLKNALKADEDYQLTSNEYFIMYWKESQEENFYRYAVYGPGNILRLKSFNLEASDGSNNSGSELVKYVENIGSSVNPVYYTDYLMNNRMTYTISQNIYRLNSSSALSSTKAITERKINQITLEASNSYCYWILNDKVVDVNGEEKYRLFEAGETNKILSSGEYFIYTNETLTNLTILGSGTLISRSNSDFVWEVPIKDASSIIENGISAFVEDEWFKIVPADASVILTEQHYISINAGSTFKLRLDKNKKDYCDLSVVSSPTSLNAAVEDADAFFAHTTGYGDFYFDYTAAGWKQRDIDETINLADFGISISGTPSVGDYIKATVGDWQILISSGGVSTYMHNEVSGEEGFINPINLKDFAISYKDANATSFTSVESLNLESDDYSWNARTLLALNISATEEQVLLENQVVKAILHNKYFYDSETIAAEIGDSFYFSINDITYSFVLEIEGLSDGTPYDIEHILLDLDEGYLVLNADTILLYDEGLASGTEIEGFTNEYVIYGGNLGYVILGGDLRINAYPEVIMSNFNLKLDGSQTLSTYTVDRNLDLVYLSLYPYVKNVFDDSRIHDAGDGEIDLEFVSGESNIISWPFSLPPGDYILPLTVGTEELDPYGSLNVYIDNNIVHSMNSDTTINFNKKQKYFLYMEIQEGTHQIKFKVNDNIAKNVPVILGNIYKYNFREGLSEFQASKILRLLDLWDQDNLFNYTYKVSEDDEIVDPLAGKSFLLNNHIYNKYTIPQIHNMEISILGKR